MHGEQRQRLLNDFGSKSFLTPLQFLETSGSRSTAFVARAEVLCLAVECRSRRMQFHLLTVYSLTKVTLQFLCVENIEFNEIAHARLDILYRLKGSLIDAIATPRPDSFGADRL